MTGEGADGGSAVVQVAPDLEEFLTDEWPRLVGSIALYTGDASLAEEIAQETAARVCRDWQKVRRLDHPGAWTYRVAMNLAKSHFRRRAVARRSEERAGLRRIETAGEADLATVLTVRREVPALAPRQRWALLLRYFADLSVKETAEAMHCPEGTVKTLTRTALLELRERGLIDHSPPGEEASHG